MTVILRFLPAAVSAFFSHANGSCISRIDYAGSALISEPVIPPPDNSANCLRCVTFSVYLWDEGPADFGNVL